MDLALASGRGPDKLTNIDGLRPYFRVEDCVAYGVRDHILTPILSRLRFLSLFKDRFDRSSGTKSVVYSESHRICDARRNAGLLDTFGR